MYRVLVVDDDVMLRNSLKEALDLHGFQVEVCESGERALEKTGKENFDLVVMDVNMSGLSGLETLPKIKQQDPSTIVIILTAYSNVQDAVKAVKLGAYNYLEKPLSSERLILLIKKALTARSLVETSFYSAPILSLGDTKSGDEKFVGESYPMRKIFGLVWKLAKVNTPVLIRGESGTGKELVAKAIHYNGPRKDQKFVALNCAAIPESLIESELFGHEKGAFTGAIERKIGKFQFANEGTLFLDEIGDLSPSAQVKLLRVLQEKCFTPVGSNREITIDVRIIAATNKNFEEMIKKKIFREDLYYRLNVLPVFLPPLRERKADIPFLVNYYIDYFNRQYDLNITGISEEVQKIFGEYSWPGNIRELRNVIEHAFIIESGNLIKVSSLPENIIGETFYEDDSSSGLIDFEDIKNYPIDEDVQSESNCSKTFYFSVEKAENKGITDFKAAKEAFEQEFIRFVLKENKGKINQTALKSNIPKKTLLRKIQKYEINAQDYYNN